jgi:hypothetical protein
MELRALAAAKRAEKAAELELKASELSSAAEPKKKPSKKLSPNSDVVVEEIDSDEEDPYEGPVEEDEGDGNELTDHTPETRTAVQFSSLPPSLMRSLRRCIVRLLSKRKRKLTESESMLQRNETMRKSTRRWSRLSERKRNKLERGIVQLTSSLFCCAVCLTCRLLSGDREIKQKNEGQFVFRWDEERSPGNIVLEVELSRHLDSSLIDVDVHPTYVSVIVKSKVSDIHTVLLTPPSASVV